MGTQGILTIIPKNELPELEERNLRIFAYCRVSRPEQDSLDSLENQKHFFEVEMKYYPNWTLLHVFHDDGISGTSRKHRDDFNEMIERADAGEVDLIITKEVSRFSRNIVDALSICRELREKNVFVWFIEDEINTQSNRDMNKLADIANQAQKESERTSRRVKWGQQQRMKAGTVFGRDMLGYNVKDGVLSINQDDVPTVKRIFELYLQGYGTFKIARKLREEGFEPKNPDGTARYKHDWSNTVILRVLRNEKYVGDLLQQKTYTPDFMDHKKKYNYGEESKYMIENHHEGIIDRETWNAVQEELLRRSPSEEQKSRHSNRYWCSGKIYCGACGGYERFVSHTKKLKNGSIRKFWTCYEAVSHGRKKTVTLNGEKKEIGCNSDIVNELVFKTAICDIVSQIISNRNDIKKEIMQEIEQVKKIRFDTKKKDTANKKIASLEGEKSNLTRLLGKGKVTEKDYAAAIEGIEEEIRAAKKVIDDAENIEQIKIRQITEIRKYSDRIDALLKFDIQTVSETTLGELTEKIIVYPGHVITFYLTCLPTPFVVRYETKGKMSTYQVELELLQGKEAEPFLFIKP